MVLTTLLCRGFGHRPGPTITGFRNIDAAVITICAWCKTPIVSTRFKASASIMWTLYGQAALDEAVKYADEQEGRNATN